MMLSKFNFCVIYNTNLIINIHKRVVEKLKEMGVGKH